MRTKQEFVSKFRVWMVGLAMEGHISHEHLSPLKRAERLCELPTEMARMLEMMYEYIHTEDKKGNGK